MLITTELVRDVLCNELIQISNACKAGIMSDVIKHVDNIADILVSSSDFAYIDVPAWTSDMTRIAQAITEARKEEVIHG